METYKVIFYRKSDGVILRTVIKKSLSLAEEVYYQHCCLPSVRNGDNSVRMEKIKNLKEQLHHI